MPDPPDTDSEKRTYSRVRYGAASRAQLVTAGGRRLPVTDLSQSGVRVITRSDAAAGGTICGRLVLLHGAEVSVEARCEWQELNQAGYSLLQLLPPVVVEKEKSFVILHFE